MLYCRLYEQKPNDSFLLDLFLFMFCISIVTIHRHINDNKRVDGCGQVIYTVFNCSSVDLLGHLEIVHVQNVRMWVGFNS